MKKTKRFLGILLALGMLSSFVTVASAEENKAETNGTAPVGEIVSTPAETKGTAPTGVKILTPAENDDYFSSLTKDEKAKINEKIRSVEKVAEELETQALKTGATAAAATKISVPGTFTMYQQTKSNYCAPATAKSMVQYLAGSSDSQDTVASALGTTSGGTDPTKIPPYLNGKQSKIYYIYSANPSQSTIVNNLYYDVVTMKSPGTTSISNPTGANWHYATDGHQLVVNAIYDDKSIIQFADPLGGTQAGWPYYYEKTAAVAGSVVFAVVW